MTETTQITFTYKDSLHIAEVQKVDGSLYITFPDAALHRIVPSGKIAIDLSQGLPVNKSPLTEQQALVLSVLGACFIKRTSIHP